MEIPEANLGRPSERERSFSGRERTDEARDGIRAIDMTDDHAGPSCDQMLAWLGAEVVKIEMADGRGDRARWLRRDDAEMDSYFFLLLNNHKKSTTLDLPSVHDPGAVDR